MLRWKTILILLALSTQAATGGRGGTWVLCIGADGHIQVEAGDARCCQGVELPSGYDGSRLAGGGTAPGCNPCTDIPLRLSATEESAAQRLQLQGAYSAPLELAPSAGLAADLLSSPIFIEPRTGPTCIHGVLTHLRTIVLRC